jgi:hypothetical protein
MIGDGDCGEIGGIKIGRGNRSTTDLTQKIMCWNIYPETGLGDP